MNVLALFALLGALAHDAGNAIDRHVAEQRVERQQGAPGAPDAPVKRDERR